MAHLRDELHEPEGGAVAHHLGYSHDLVQRQLRVGENRAGQRAEPASAFAAPVPPGPVGGLPVEPRPDRSAVRASRRMPPLVEQPLDGSGPVLLEALPRLRYVS